MGIFVGLKMMNPQKIVIPAKAGIQTFRNKLKILDSLFQGNDETGLSTIVY
jgi:hypothetical protein